MFELKKYI